MEQATPPSLRAHAQRVDSDIQPDPTHRRLTSDYLVSQVRRAGDDFNRDAFKSVRAACVQELGAFCSKEVVAVQELLVKTNGDISSYYFAEAARNAEACLATNSDSLRRPCLETMVALFLQGNPTAPPPQETKPTASWLAPTPPTGEPPSQVSHRMRREPKYEADDDSSDEPKPAAGGVHIYVYNNNNGGGGGGATASQGGGAVYGYGDQGHGRHRLSHGHGVHPAVWLVALPFFCVGVVVVGKRIVSYVKQRRPASLTAEYVPLASVQADS